LKIENVVPWGRNFEEYQKKEVKIFPLLDLKNQKSKYLEAILDILKNKGFETKIIKTNYEFQKGANYVNYYKCKLSG